MPVSVYGERDTPQRSQDLANGRFVAGRFPAGHGPEENSDFVLRTQHQWFAGQQIEDRAQREEFGWPDVIAGLGRFHEPDDAVEQVLLAAAGGCDSDGVEMGGAASGTSRTTADQGADHGDGGTEREHPVRTPAGRGDPVDESPPTIPAR